MTTDNIYSVEYKLEVEDGSHHSYKLEIDKTTVQSRVDASEKPPEWARLNNQKCEQCTLVDSEYCPVALRLAAPMRRFGALMSHQRTHTTVKTEDRDYIKDSDVQDALRSLFGLIIATSGCPEMRPFKYMARFHLPFSSLEETVSRITAAYLMQQFLAQSEREGTSVNIKNLDTLYKRMEALNLGITKRLRGVGAQDGAINAVVILSTMSSLIPLVVQQEFDKLKQMLAS